MLKTPISYYGGKQKMLPVLLKLIPEHTIYTELFCGGAALFWAKNPSKIEVINFYCVLQNKFDELKPLIDATLHSREQHSKANIIYKAPMIYTDIERAWAFWVSCTQSYLSSPGGTFTTSKKDKPAAPTKIHYAKNNLQYNLSERLHRVTIEHDDVLKVLTRYDSADCFHYIDPPYYNADMGHYKGYSLEDFTNLLKKLSNVKGKFLLSSYPSDILSEYTKANNWHQILIERTLDASSNKRKKIEVLTANYPI